jgi:uncharacterized protein (TIGR01777 family)
MPIYGLSPVSARAERLHVAISGASGLIGSALCSLLVRGGHEVQRLVRREPRPGQHEIGWDPATGHLDALRLSGTDAVVHLAGENIATRWTAAKKLAIRDSRVVGTRLLAKKLSELERPPAVLVTASATGYYGDQGDMLITEAEGPGEGFLAELCRDWEAATAAAERRGIRVAYARLGVVLSAAGGALMKMLPAFRWGMGGVLDGGEQYFPWVAQADAAGALNHILLTPELGGPVNVTAPNAVTNAEFTRALAEVLDKRVGPALPGWLLQLVFGEMAFDTLLASQRVVPAKLLDSGYQFQYPELKALLAAELG